MSIALAQKHNVPVGGAANNAAANAPKTKTWDDYVRELGSTNRFMPARNLKFGAKLGIGATVYKGARMRGVRKTEVQERIHDAKLRGARNSLFTACEEKYGREIAERAFADCGIENAKITDKQLVKLDKYLKSCSELSERYGSDIADLAVRQNDYKKGAITGKKIAELEKTAARIQSNCYTPKEICESLGGGFTKLAEKHFGKNLDEMSDAELADLRTGAQHFRRAADREFVSESIEFLGATHDLIRECNISDISAGKLPSLKEKFINLYESYILTGAEKEVNISFKNRKKATNIYNAIIKNTDPVTVDQLKKTTKTCREDIDSMTRNIDSLINRFYDAGGFEEINELED